MLLAGEFVLSYKRFEYTNDANHRQCIVIKYHTQDPKSVIFPVSEEKSGNLHDPNIRGQVCWSIGKFLSIIGHFAFTVSLRTNNGLFSQQIGHIISYVNMPDRVGDVSIFRDPE